MADDFDGGRLPVRDTWEISINGGQSYDYTKIDTPFRIPNIHFGLEDGEYADNQIRTRQTINGVLSPFAGLDAFTFDRTPPEVTPTGVASITLKEGEAYNDLGATATDALDDTVAVTVDSSAVNTATAGTYTVTYRATDHAGNTGTATREVIVQAPPRLRALL